MWQVVSGIEEPPRSLPFASSGTLDHSPLHDSGLLRHAFCAEPRPDERRTPCLMARERGRSSPSSSTLVGVRAFGEPYPRKTTAVANKKVPVYRENQMPEM